MQTLITITRCVSDLCIGGVEDGLYHEHIHTPFHQTLHLLPIRWHQLIKCCRCTYIQKWLALLYALSYTHYSWKNFRSTDRRSFLIVKWTLCDLLIFRYSGFSTEGERESVLFVGPTEPMVKRRIPAVGVRRYICIAMQLILQDRAQEKKYLYQAPPPCRPFLPTQQKLC